MLGSDDARRFLTQGTVALKWVAVGGLLVYAATCETVGRPAGGFQPLLDGWLYDLIIFADVAIVLSVAACARRGRVAWNIFGVGLAAWGSGFVWWALVVRHQDPAPFPSIADALWLAFYPCAFVTLVLLARSCGLRARGVSWLDSLCAALASAAALAAVTIPTVSTALTGASTAAVVTNFAYPIGDLVLLSLVVGILVQVGWRSDVAWRQFAAGLLILVTANTVYLLRVADNSYEMGSWLDLLWPLAVTLMAFAAGRPPSSDRPVVVTSLRLAVPFIFGIVATVVLAANTVVPVNPVALVLAGGALATAWARALTAVRASTALAASRTEARTDDLTGLGNRRLLRERLDRALERRGTNERVAIVLFGLDRFKDVNDSLGHDAGDELLCQVSRRLHHALGDRAVLTRLGGDQFAVLLGADVRRDAGAAEMTERIRATLRAPVEVGGLSLSVDCSIGIAVCPEHASEGSDLVRLADVSMYHAKTHGLPVAVYQPGIDHHSRKRLQTIEELRVAMQGEQIVVHYQPKVDARGCTVGVESLVRWEHPTRGLLHPVDFLPLVGVAGLFDALTGRVLDPSLMQCAAWLAAGRRVPVAVNTPAATILSDGFAAEVDAHLRRHGVPPEMLTLEITEEAFIEEPDRCRAVLEQIRALGVRVSLDDYGTSYSTLAWLHRLAVDEIKLDRSFLADLEHDPTARIIVAKTVEMAHSLGITVVAEGVETRRLWETVVSLGCDLAQGYHFARPLPAEQLDDWIVRAQPVIPGSARSPVPG